MDIKNIPPEVSYSGWIIDGEKKLRKITSDRESNAGAADAILIEAKRLGLEADGKEFYVMKETIILEAVSKTTFSLTSSVDLIDK
jgi:hypothetical protein